MIENLVEIKVEELMNVAAKAQRDGYRFITTSCANAAEGSFDVTYHFDKDYDMFNVRIRVTTEEPVPSISPIYFCAVLVENEMKELFGLNVTGIAVDYGGHFILSGEDLNAPFATPQILIEKREKGENKNV